MPRGGKRINAGRPKGSRNKKKSLETKQMRVPVLFWDSVKEFIKEKLRHHDKQNNKCDTQKVEKKEN